MPVIDTALFIGNTNDDVTPDDIKRFFGPFGSIKHVDTKGIFCFCEFKDASAASAARKALNGTSPFESGQKIKIEFKKAGHPPRHQRNNNKDKNSSAKKHSNGQQRHKPRQSSKSDHQRDEPTTVWVGNINDDVTEAQLRDVFSAHGKVLRADSKGQYGFVDMARRRDADRAIKALDGKNPLKLDRPIRCQLRAAKDRAKNSDRKRHDRKHKHGGNDSHRQRGRDDRRRDSRVSARSRSRSRGRGSNRGGGSEYERSSSRRHDSDVRDSSHSGGRSDLRDAGVSDNFVYPPPGAASSGHHHHDHQRHHHHHEAPVPVHHHPHQHHDPYARHPADRHPPPAASSHHHHHVPHFDDPVLAEKMMLLERLRALDEMSSRAMPPMPEMYLPPAEYPPRRSRSPEYPPRQSRRSRSSPRSQYGRDRDSTKRRPRSRSPHHRREPRRHYER